MNYKIDMNDVLSKFAQECESLGLIIPSSGIIADGKKHRCPVIQSKTNKPHGEYKLYAKDISRDYPFNGVIVNYKIGQSTKWNYKQSVPHGSPSFSKFINYEEEHKKRQQTKDETHKKIAYIANTILNRGSKTPVGVNYLDTKQVKAFGVIFRSYKNEDDIVTIPARDIHGTIWSFQSISLKKGKQFLKDGRKSGLFHKIGVNELKDDYDGYLFITEGYATGASIHMATNYKVICAFDSGNLAEVAKSIKAFCPKAKLVFCADLDYVGIKKAVEASGGVDGYVVLPDFSNNCDIQNNTNISDFNDLHCLSGLPLVKQQIDTQIPISKQLFMKAGQLYHGEISIDDIEPHLLNIEENIIKLYLIKKDAEKFVGLQSTPEYKQAIEDINPKYQDILKNEIQILIKQKEKISK